MSAGSWGRLAWRRTKKSGVLSLAQSWNRGKRQHAEFESSSSSSSQFLPALFSHWARHGWWVVFSIPGRRDVWKLLYTQDKENTPPSVKFKPKKKFPKKLLMWITISERGHSEPFFLPKHGNINGETYTGSSVSSTDSFPFLMSTTLKGTTSSGLIWQALITPRTPFSSSRIEASSSCREKWTPLLFRNFAPLRTSGVRWSRQCTREAGRPKVRICWRGGSGNAWGNLTGMSCGAWWWRPRQIWGRQLTLHPSSPIISPPNRHVHSFQTPQ